MSSSKALLKRFRKAKARGLARLPQASGRKPQVCRYAEFRLRRPCCGDRYFCRKPGAPTAGMPVTGKYCRRKCTEREENDT